MEWNWRVLTANSNEKHYEGVKEVANNKKTHKKNGLPTQHAVAAKLGQPKREGGERDVTRKETKERDPLFVTCMNKKPPTQPEHGATPQHPR